MDARIDGIVPIISTAPPAAAFNGLNLPALDLTRVFLRIENVPEEIKVGVAGDRKMLTGLSVFGYQFQSIGRRYTSLAAAVSHSLFGDSSGANRLIDILRARFVHEEPSNVSKTQIGIDDTLRSNSKKNKLSVDKALRFLSRCNDGSLDIVIADAQQRSAAVFSRPGQSSGRWGAKHLTMLLFDEGSQTFEPIGIASNVEMRDEIQELPSRDGGDAVSSVADNRETVNTPVNAMTTIVFNGADGPFSSLRYPDVVMGNVGMCTVLGTSCSEQFGWARLRFTVSLVMPMASVALCILALVTAPREYSTCCGIGNSCEASSLPVANATAVVDPFGICYEDMCNGNGTMFSHAFHGYYFGSGTSPGRLLVVVCILEAMSLGSALLVQFLFLRTIAQLNARGRFWYFAVAGHVTVSAVCFALTTFVAADFNATKFHVVPCDAFPEETKKLCVANYAACSLRSAVFVEGTTSGAILIALAASAAAGLITGLIPPNWGLSTTSVAPARPDTMIFRPAKYAPDGLSDAEASRIQVRIRQDLLKAVGATELVVQTESARQSVSARRQSARQTPRLAAAAGAALFISQLKNKLLRSAKPQLRYASGPPELAADANIPPVLERQIATIVSRVKTNASPPSMNAQQAVHAVEGEAEQCIAEVAARVTSELRH